MAAAVTPSTSSGPSSSPKGRTDWRAWAKAHKVELGVAAAAAAGGLALLRKKSSSASPTSTNPAGSSTSSASGQPAGTYAGTALPTAFPSTPTTDWGPQLSALQQEIAGIEAQIGSPAAGVASGTAAASSGGVDTSTTTPAPTPAAATGGGYGAQTINGTPYDVLGYLTHGGAYEGYEVGNGAPVFFLPPGGSLQTNITKQAIESEPTGTELLTPAAYAASISAQPGPNQF